MSQPFRLGKYNICGFVSIVNVERAKEFYRHTLGLTLLSEEPPFALVFDAHGIMLRLGMAKELAGPRHGARLERPRYRGGRAGTGRSGSAI